MNSKNFIEELSVRLDVSIDSVNVMLDSLISEFAKTSSNLDGIVVAGFGTFTPKLREERISVHPASGKKLLIPPRIYLTFKSSPVLKQKLNNGQ